MVVVWLQSSLVPCSCIACCDKDTDKKDETSKCFFVCNLILSQLLVYPDNPSSCLVSDELTLAVLPICRCQEQQR